MDGVWRVPKKRKNKENHDILSLSLGLSVVASKQEKKRTTFHPHDSRTRKKEVGRVNAVERTDKTPRDSPTPDPAVGSGGRGSQVV